MHAKHTHWITLVCLCGVFSSVLEAQEPKAPPLHDQRLGALLGERGDFSFQPPDSEEQGRQRANRVRSILQVTLGLWPPPTRTPLAPIVHSRRTFDRYTIENVILESAPGFFLTGNLYRPYPLNPNQKYAAVLSPHGHFPGGRFIDEGPNTVREKIAQGAERFENGGRSFMQSRCVQLARMGCVVFHYDMVGYGDSVQIPLDVAHRFSSLRRQFTQVPQSGFYSARAEQELFNPMGLHVWNSQRALDFLIGLPDVDPNRVAVTGGSGGGTQTFMLCAIDDRPRVSVPVVIVSTTRQGGCTCENISGLRWGSYNLEFAALHAPKPQLLISADDATRSFRERGFPDLQAYYRLLGAESHVAHAPLIQFPHNYNYVSRTTMYHWLNQHLSLGHDEPILEGDYARQSRKELTVWNDQHPQPKPDPNFVDQLREWFAEDARRQLAALTPTNLAQMQQYREIVGEAWSVLLRRIPSHVQPRWQSLRVKQHQDYQETHGVLHFETFNGRQARLPVVRLEVPPQDKDHQRTLLWFHSAGKACLYNNDGTLRTEARQALRSGYTVISADLLLQGDFLGGSPKPKQQRHLAGEEAFAGWTYCYNLPLFAQRTYDTMAVMTWLEQRAGQQSQFNVLATGTAGPIAGAAVALIRSSKLQRTAIETGGFRFENVTDVYDADFLPGSVKYGDLPGLLALAAPREIRISGETEPSLSLVRAAYQAEGEPNNLHTGAEDRDATISWLLQLTNSPSLD